jgi:hypothetical protein
MSKKRKQYSGSRVIKAGPITIACMSQEARECLDRAMVDWLEFKKGFPKGHRASIYGFAYWLIRYSGLFRPVRQKKSK